MGHGLACNWGTGAPLGHGRPDYSGHSKFLEFAVKGFAVYFQNFCGFSLVTIMGFKCVGNIKLLKLFNGLNKGDIEI